MIYVTGANGRIGRYVMRRLNGIAVVRRRCGFEREVVTDYEIEELRRIFRDAKAVIHLAGKVVGSRKELWRSNVDLTENVVNAISDDVKLIFSSSIAVYGSKPPYMANEETPINPDNDYAKTKAKAEEIVSSHRNSVIMRIGTVYGPFKDYFRMLSVIDKGVVPIIGRGENRIPFVHVEDVAECILRALEKDARGIYVVCGRSERLIDIMVYTARLLRGRFFIVRIPPSIARTLSKLLELSEHVKILTSDRVFDISKAVKELGFNPRDVWTGIREVVNVWRSSNEGKG